MRRPLASLAVCGALVAIALSPPTRARAHGGPPVVEALSFDPSDERHVFAGTNFGTMTSDDGGASWSWLCPSAVRLQISSEDPLVLTSSAGSMFVGDSAGVYRSSALGCEWTSVLGAPGSASAGALARAPGVLFAGTSSDGSPNTIQRSRTDGESWEVVLDSMEEGVWFESILVSPSDPTRVYAVQNRPPIRAEPWETTTWRSDDGGDHWTSEPFTLALHEWRLYLLAVDPTDPDRILAHTQNLYPGEHERVVRSDDGGTSWHDVMTLRQVLGGAWSPDGSAAYLAGPVDGLWRSSDGARSFESLHPELFLRCVVATDDALYVCADDFSAGFAIGRSTDGGCTFEPLARLRSITGVLSCPATSGLGTACEPERPTLDAVLTLAPEGDAGPPSVCSPDAAMEDAGTTDAGPTLPAPSCACDVGGAHRPVDLAVLALALATIVRRRRTRPRASDADDRVERDAAPIDVRSSRGVRRVRRGLVTGAT